jgi:hypothetical protein
LGSTDNFSSPEYDRTYDWRTSPPETSLHRKAMQHQLLM